MIVATCTVHVHVTGYQATWGGEGGGGGQGKGAALMPNLSLDLGAV